MEQTDAISLASEGHSFVLTGSCGTGKTYTLKEIIQRLSDKKNVAVTASTGMASLQLGMKATTLHHWCGIYDGRFTLEKLAELFDNDDKFASAKERILSAECLIIDEISILSQKIFEMVEFVCRHVKQNKLCFGGMQVIGCGDFKQLPPVPNQYLKDDGNFCFSSPLFNVAFPHHVNLTKVIRQYEEDLIHAVTELCNGAPSDYTVQMLRSLNVNLDVPADQIIRLYGTNYDVRYVNEEMLENHDGHVHVFKATDEGKRRLLLRCQAPKTLLLKEGAPVILIKNLAGNLFNGQRGKVHKLIQGSAPIINFNGKLHKLEAEKFEIFDVGANRVMASRMQVPVILSYAMTVHRAQGQTIQYVEIDCASFFAPGQLGVAVGRAVNKKGLSVRNFSLAAATLKHPESVYNFYKQTFVLAQDNLSCCARNTIDNVQLSATDWEEQLPSSDSDADGDATDFPRLECPFDVNDFLEANKQAEFMQPITPELIDTNEFKHHIQYVYFKVDSCLKTDPSTTNKFVQAYKDLNDFMVGDEHIKSIKCLFGVTKITKNQNKFSSKLALWLMDQKIQAKCKDVLSQNPGPSQSSCSSVSESGSAKLRYVAGVCIHKIRNRLRHSVERNIGKTTKTSKIAKKLDFKKEKMLKALSVSEESVDSSDPSLLEIQTKQYKAHGLTIVNDVVFNFFVQMNSTLQSLLTTENLHLNLENIHFVCRNSIDSNYQLLSDWISLFGSTECEDIEDEILLDLIMELFQSVTEHFVKLAIVDSLKKFKMSIPRKKKQALRTKVHALGERECKKRKKSSPQVERDVILCPVCDTVCEEEPENDKEASIGCDRCDGWYHYSCVNLTGKESFLQSEASSWFCPKCKKGKGKGKKTKQ